jgi:hypothetical protein
MNRKEIVDRISAMGMDDDDEIVLAEGFDDAIIGISVGLPPRAVYDADKCIRAIRLRSKMSLDEAEEYFEFNVLKAFVGKQTPIFYWSIPK